MRDNKDLEEFFEDSDFFDDDIKQEIINDITVYIEEENIVKDKIIKKQHDKLLNLKINYGSI